MGSKFPRDLSSDQSSIGTDTSNRASIHIDDIPKKRATGYTNFSQSYCYNAQKCQATLSPHMHF